MVRLDILYTLNHGSSPCKQTINWGYGNGGELRQTVYEEKTLLKIKVCKYIGSISVSYTLTGTNLLPFGWVGSNPTTPTKKNIKKI